MEAKPGRTENLRAAPRPLKSETEKAAPFSAGKRGDFPTQKNRARKTLCPVFIERFVKPQRLLDLDLGASRFDLFLDLLGFLFGNAFLHRFRCALDQGFSFCKS